LLAFCSVGTPIESLPTVPPVLFLTVVGLRPAGLCDLVAVALPEKGEVANKESFEAVLVEVLSCTLTPLLGFGAKVCQMTINETIMPVIQANTSRGDLGFDSEPLN
jgi:hypothetical protein